MSMIHPGSDWNGTIDSIDILLGDVVRVVNCLKTAAGLELLSTFDKGILVLSAIGVDTELWRWSLPASRDDSELLEAAMVTFPLSRLVISNVGTLLKQSMELEGEILLPFNIA